MEWKSFAAVTATVFSLLIASPGARADETTCMSDYEDGAILHFICFCNSPRLVHPSGSGGGADDDSVSLSSFAYGLSGSLFAKSIFVTFQSCRFLRVILDQKELRRIGSPNFRPDLQIKRLSFEHVYHLASESAFIGHEYKSDLFPIFREISPLNQFSESTKLTDERPTTTGT